MHFEDGAIPASYQSYVLRKTILILVGGGLLLLVTLGAISLGAVAIPFDDVWKSLVRTGDDLRWSTIIWDIRIPQALTAIVAGAGLAASGVAMQSVLRNPLGSPFTLGISHAAAFGAALSVMFLNGGATPSAAADSITSSNPYLTTAVAFCLSLIATGVIMGVSRYRGASPEVLVLCGVALGALFSAGTMFLQYFADDVQLAAIVFWTFGDTARASWTELGIMALATASSSVYFFINRWNYNAIDAGDETAKGLGIGVERVRLLTLLWASLTTAVIVSFLGVIGFVGLVCPHMLRRLVGDDHRFLLPGSILCGALLLVASDTVARLAMSPHVLPVSILTAFMGAPVFLYLIIRGAR